MGAAVGGSGKRRGPIVGINITPMVDVVLVLLVIMMVSAEYVVSESIQVDLPKTASSDGTSGALTVVTISRTGDFYLKGEKISADELNIRLAELYQRDRETSLVVTADAAAEHGRVMQVIDTARVVGISKFSVSVERRE
jgi:biopolymer transport protein ExbD